MGINDDAVIDLDDTLVDNDIVQSPPITHPNDKQTTVIPFKSSMGPKAPVVSEQAIQDMLNTDIQFKIIKDNVNEIVDLETVEKEFLAQESISQSTVKQLDQYFTGLLSDRLSLEEFTISPSKVNFNHVKQYIHSHLAQEQVGVLSDFTKIIEQLPGYSNIIKDVLDNYLKPFQLSLQSIRELATVVIADLSSNKHSIVPIQNGEHIEFQDIAEIDLVTLDFSTLKLNQGTVTQLSFIRDNIKHVLEDIDVRILLVLAVECNRISYPADTAIIARAATRPISILLLAKLFNSEALQQYIDTFEDRLFENYNLLASITEQSSTLQDYQSIKLYITQESQPIHAVISSTLKIMLYMNHLSVLAWNMKELFECISKVTHPTA